MAREFRIYPPIGIARVGNSESDICFGPETYLGLPTEYREGVEVPIESFRDQFGRVKRQAARFYIYAYDSEHPEQLGSKVSIGNEDVVDIVWHAHLANKKACWYTFKQLEGEDGYKKDHPLRNPQVVSEAARRKLIIDPGPYRLSGKNSDALMTRGQGQNGYHQTFPPATLLPEPIDELGELRTDDNGNLIVLGGYGHSGSDKEPKIDAYANNNYWWDDVSDGSISATIRLSDGTEIDVVSPAWVIVAPPAYAPQIPNVVTLFDVMYDVAIKHFNLNSELFSNGSWNLEYLPEFETDIRPLLDRAGLNQWVCAIPQDAHLFDLTKLGDPDQQDNAIRERIFNLLRPGDQTNQKSDASGKPMMPLLCGDNPITETLPSKYLTLTETQLFKLSQWSKGKFVTRDSSRKDSPEMNLTKAVLSNCVGGPFCPGIEMTWIARNPSLYESPFRIRHKPVVDDHLSLEEDLTAGMEPGDVTKRMAIPWQADFNECSTQRIGDDEIMWWPAQRPMLVTVEPKEVLLTAPPPAAWARGIPSHGDTPGDLPMVVQWKNLGFILGSTDPFNPIYYEVERNDGSFDEPELS